MTIRVTRLRRQVYKGTLELYIDDRLIARLPPRASAKVRGSGAIQHLVVKCEGMIDSEPLQVTDPGYGRMVGVLVTYAHRRTGFFTRPDKCLKAEIMGEGDEPDEPVELPTA
jgi:hypothetical protein